MKSYYYLDYLHREIFLKEEDIQAVPESGRANGFVWLLVSREQALKLWKADAIPLYRLREDDSESLIETEEELEKTIRGGTSIGIEVEFISVLADAARMYR